MPTDPSQWALFLPSISIQVDWEEFVQEVRDRHPKGGNTHPIKKQGTTATAEGLKENLYI